jgi:phage shock protein C
MLMNRRLYRSRTDTILGGLAAGVANYLNADPALVRIAWAILIPLTGGAALLAYIVGWIVVPEEPKSEATAATAPSSDPDAPVAAVSAPGSAPTPERRLGGGNAGLWVGLGLIALGAWFLVREFLPQIRGDLVWPIVIVGIGLVILVGALRRREG